MSYFMQPVNYNTPFWGVLFGSVSSSYVHARATLEYSTETRLEFVKQFLPNFFHAKKSLLFDTFFLGTCWTISRFIIENGLLAIANNLWDSNDPRTKRKTEALVIAAWTYLSSFIACGRLYLARTHFIPK